MPEYDDLPYRSSALPVDIQPNKTPTEDEAHYSTLASIKRLFGVAIADLYKDFNAFDLLKNEDKNQASLNLLRQIEAKQEAYGILKPLFDTLTSAVDAVDEKYRS